MKLPWKTRDLVIVAILAVKLTLIALLVLWIFLGPAIVRGGGFYSDGDWTSYEKGKIIGLLEKIAENTKR